VNHIEGKNLPSRAVVYEILDSLFEILFPGYIGETDITWTEIPYFVGDRVNSVFIKLSEQISRALKFQCRLHTCKPKAYDHCAKSAKKAAEQLLINLPDIRKVIILDVEAAYNGDPAAKSFDEIILSYPYIEAIATHRLAHNLYNAGVPLIPRMMSERAHSRTGMDIHPGAIIGNCFFVDHGTGVVIGETTRIGDNVKLYQGVTLGALSFKKDERGRLIREGTQRHPTLEDNVTVYSNATILGGQTVIGKNSVVGGNVWLTHSVPPDSVVTMSNPELMIRKSKKR
jgi:serine O-acetyltransferase